MIHLPCRPSDSLDWDVNAFPDAGPLLFRFDLGLESPFFPIDDEMHFQALSLALNKFTQEIWPKFHERISGAVLYRGSIDFSSYFLWTEKQRENWNVWSQERPPLNHSHMQRLFCADAFAHYFQMLAHRLPDELPLYLLLDGSGVGTIAERHQLISRERFDHFILAVKGLPHAYRLTWVEERIEESEDKPSVALCFPEEKMCTENVLNRMDHQIQSMKIPFRIVSEAFLTEEWDGVDQLHVLKEAMTLQGDRKLKGFLATAGEICWV